MPKKEIIFIIDGGQVEVSTTGFKGAACEAATKAFEDVLGGAITGKKRTADYHKTEDVRITQGAK